MEAQKPAFEKYIFVCERHRDDGVCCASAGTEIREALKNEVKRRGLASKIRVSQAGCLDVCAKGPNVLLMPDDVWFSRVSLADVEKILAKAEGNSCTKS